MSLRLYYRSEAETAWCGVNGKNILRHSDFEQRRRMTRIAFLQAGGTNRMTALIIRQTIDVDAPVETLWKILTDNEFIPQYMFGCLAETDWKPGSPLLWKGKTDGTLYVKGNVVSFEPPHRLVYTVIDPNSDIADIPSNYLTMTCE